MNQNTIEPNDEIITNLDFLTHHTGNLKAVIIRLIQSKIISVNESQIIGAEKTDLSCNFKLYNIILTKGWVNIRGTVLKILTETGNAICADKINGVATPAKKTRRGILKSHWWPEEKYLPKSFYERKSDQNLFVESLKNILCHNINGITVINQKVAVSGLGGVGKTTTAKWFAKYFHEDYDHIIWIDCADGSLLKSFKCLARDLNVENRHEMDMRELAGKSFEILEDLNCLLIYDNAECYTGTEGIRDVLPQNKKNFHVIITSRNREWGHESGDGKIPEFQMDVFEKHEGVDFMKKNVHVFQEGDEWKLEKICEFLGHLPLALQIAIATLNQKKISLNDYIERLTKSDQLIHRNFDDYEKTIDKTMKISLDLIKVQEGMCGNLAYRVLILLGYVIPDDVESEFLGLVENESNAIISDAAELLEKYSLVSLTKFEANELFTVSIHRLLQQVIRHNGRSGENETIKKIMVCKGCWNYKLIPYCYANENLQQEFAQTRTEIMNKVYLKELLNERRFQEAVELSRLNKNENFSNPVTTYNHAWCLYHHRETNEAIRLLENLMKQDLDFPTKTTYGEVFNEGGIIRNDRDLTKEIVAGQLFTISANDKTKFKEAQEIINSGTLILPIIGNTSLQDLVRLIEDLSIFDYTIHYYGSSHFMSLTVQDTCFGKRIFLYECSFDKNRPLHLNSIKELSLHQVRLFVTHISAEQLNITNSILTLTNSSRISAERLICRDIDIQFQGFQDTEIRNGDILKLIDIDKITNVEINDRNIGIQELMTISSKNSPFCSLNLISGLIKTVSLSALSHYILEYNSKLQTITISIKYNAPIKTIQLSKCTLDEKIELHNNLDNLKLDHISLPRKLSNVFDLSKLKNIEICNTNNIEMVGTIIRAEWMHLKNVEILDWDKGLDNWIVDSISFQNIPDIPKIGATIGELILEWTSIDLSTIPQTTKKLICRNTKFINFAGNNIIGMTDSPCVNLQELTLENISFESEKNEVLDGCYNVSSIIPTGVIRLVLRKSTVSLERLVGIENLQLSYTNIVLNNSNLQIAPKFLTLYNVNVYQDDEEFKCYVNHFIDFSQMKVFDLKSLSLDLNEPFHVPDVTLYYFSAEWDWIDAIDWPNAKWIIDKFTICGNGSNPFLEKNQMVATEIRMGECDVNLSNVPPSTESLSLLKCNIVNFPYEMKKKFMYPCTLKELSLIRVNFNDVEDNSPNNVTDISDLIPKSLRKLTLDFSNCPVSVSLPCLSLVQNLDLRNCQIIFENKFRRIKPIELTLRNVKAIERSNYENVKVVNFDKFIDFSTIKHIYLERMSIDMQHPVIVNELTLRDSRVVNWRTGKWSINLLRTWQVPQETEMKIKKIKIMTQSDANFHYHFDWFYDRFTSNDSRTCLRLGSSL